MQTSKFWKKPVPIMTALVLLTNLVQAQEPYLFKRMGLFSNSSEIGVYIDEDEGGTYRVYGPSVYTVDYFWKIAAFTVSATGIILDTNIVSVDSTFLNIGSFGGAFKLGSRLIGSGGFSRYTLEMPDPVIYKFRNDGSLDTMIVLEKAGFNAFYQGKKQ